MGFKIESFRVKLSVVEKWIGDRDSNRDGRIGCPLGDSKLLWRENCLAFSADKRRWDVPVRLMPVGNIVRRTKVLKGGAVFFHVPSISSNGASEPA